MVVEVEAIVHLAVDSHTVPVAGHQVTGAMEVVVAGAMEVVVAGDAMEVVVAGDAMEVVVAGDATEVVVAGVHVSWGLAQRPGRVVEVEPVEVYQVVEVEVEVLAFLACLFLVGGGDRGKEAWLRA